MRVSALYLWLVCSSTAIVVWRVHLNSEPTLLRAVWFLNYFGDRLQHAQTLPSQHFCVLHAFMLRLVEACALQSDHAKEWNSMTLPCIGVEGFA